MRKPASLVALLVALTLFAVAISGLKDDADHSAENIHEGFQKLEAHDYAGLDRDSDKHDAEERFRWIECTIGAAFLIAAFALWKSEDASTDEEELTSFGDGLSLR